MTENKNKNKNEIKLNKIICGKSEEKLKEIPDNFFDGIVTDPPYELNFMGKAWDASGIAYNVELWKEVLRVAKPGSFLFCFGGTRTYHRVACAIEDAGWQIKDSMSWLYGCLSEDTKILTTEGWKGHNEIKNGDIVFSLDMKKDVLVKSNVDKVFKYNHAGKMVSLKNHNTDQLVTLNHKVVNKQSTRWQVSGIRSWYKEDNWKYQEARCIKSDQYILPLASTYDGDYSIGEDFAEVIGWVLSEGHFHKDTNAITIYQSSVNNEYIRKIRKCLKAAKLNSLEGQRLRKYKNKEYIEYNWYIGGEGATRIKKIIPNKKPTNKLWDLKLSEKERLVLGLCAGDGSKSKHSTDKYAAFYQNDIKFLNWFQVMLHLTGKQGWLNEKKMSCSIHYNATTQIQGKHYKNRIIDYDGLVWCINTNAGNFIAKRNGKIFITGNSGFPKSTSISKQIDKEAGLKRKGILRTDGKATNSGSGCYQMNDGSDISMQKVFEDGHPITRDAKQWDGYGTALKPAHEPIIVAMKPLEKGLTYAQNAKKWNVAGLNIDAARIEYKENDNCYEKGVKRAEAPRANIKGGNFCTYGGRTEIIPTGMSSKGRWPSNVILSHSPDCVCVGTKQINEGAPEGGYSYDGNEYKVEGFVKTCKPKAPSNRGQETVEVYACVPDCPIRIMDSQSGISKSNLSDNRKNKSSSMFLDGEHNSQNSHNDSGGASRFFYCAKASRSEREKGLREFAECVKCGKFNSKTHTAVNPETGAKSKENCTRNNHLTVKPVSLMRYLLTLIKMPSAKENKQVILDPFCGSGTTLVAAEQHGINYIGIDQDSDNVLISMGRIDGSDIFENTCEKPTKL